MRSYFLTLVSTDSAWLGEGLDPRLSCTNLGLSKDPQGSPLHSYFENSQGPLSLQTEPCWVQGGELRGETQPPAHCREGKPVTPHMRGQTGSCIFQSSSHSITSLPSPDFTSWRSMWPEKGVSSFPFPPAPNWLCPSLHSFPLSGG